MSSAREVAYKLLSAVATEDAYANLALPKLISAAGLSARDAGFATELCFGALRWRLYLDAVIEKCAQRPIDRIDPQSRDLLRLGSYQLLFMRVPAHAAVGETVALVDSLRLNVSKGFVNANLRRVSERGREQWDAAIVKGLDEVEGLALRYSHPRWQVAALRDALGDKRDEIEDLLATNNAAPEVTMVSRVGEAGVERLIAAGATPGRWSPLAAKVEGDPSSQPGFATGDVAVQDEGSQLVTLAFLEAEVVGPQDRRWLDLCAGPGGKAALMASIGRQRGASLTAVELQPHRAELVRHALKSFDNASVQIADGRDPAWASGDWDRVLLDAPCTGLGVLRRRAESRWRRTPADVAELARLQRQLLTNALAAVRSGGVVGYVTCSPHLAETEFVVEDVLSKRDDVELLDAEGAALSIPGLRNRAEFAAVSASGPYLRLWPHRHGTDGMFLALLRRR